MVKFRTRRKSNGSIYRYPIINGTEQPKKRLNAVEAKEQSIEEDVKTPIIKNALKIAFQYAPLGREIYVCYYTARFLHSSWNVIYSTYQKSNEEIKQNAYGVTREGIKSGLTTYQTNLVWSKIDNNVPDDIKDESKVTLTNVMSNISNEEISIVEYALRHL